MANRTKLTDEKREEFLEYLRQTGNITKAADACVVARRTLYDHRKANEEFKEKWDEAVVIATEHLEAEARRRAFDGVDEPVYYKGAVVGHVRKYSDNLLMFTLKGLKPEKYRDNVKADLNMRITNDSLSDEERISLKQLAKDFALSTASDSREGEKDGK